MFLNSWRLMEVKKRSRRFAKPSQSTYPRPQTQIPHLLSSDFRGHRFSQAIVDPVKVATISAAIQFLSYGDVAIWSSGAKQVDVEILGFTPSVVSECRSWESYWTKNRKKQTQDHIFHKYFLSKIFLVLVCCRPQWLLILSGTRIHRLKNKYWISPYFFEIDRADIQSTRSPLQFAMSLI